MGGAWPACWASRALHGRCACAGHGRPARKPLRNTLKLPHFAPKAKRAIYLFMSGGPSQIDLLDYKPNLAALYDKDIPDSVRGAQQLTGMTAGQARFPIAPSHWAFKRYGQTGTWVSDLLPYTGRDGRRPGDHQIHQHRSHQSRAGHHADEYRQHESPASPAWARGSPMGWAA